MARIKIETIVPAFTEVDHARKQALLAAAHQLNIHVVEETLLPVIPKKMKPDPAGGPSIEIDSPNDHTVERRLTTYWDFLGATKEVGQ